LFKTGDCYIRQDKFFLSVPCWEATGNDVYAKWFGAVSGEPYEIHGDIGRVPLQQMDPQPLVEASVNGGPPKRFMFYTGAPWPGVSGEVAKEAGLTPVYKERLRRPPHMVELRRAAARYAPTPDEQTPSPYRCGWPVSNMCTARAASPAPDVTLDFTDMNVYLAQGKAGWVGADRSGRVH
jgi:hypothetical protein